MYNTVYILEYPNGSLAAMDWQYGLYEGVTKQRWKEEGLASLKDIEIFESKETAIKFSGYYKLRDGGTLKVKELRFILK